MKKLIIGILAIVFSLFLISCIQDYLIAPEGTTLSITAKPDTIYYDNDYSTITVTAFEQSGRPIRDGIIVYFYTDLGSIAEQAKTKNGKASVKLYSTGKEGIANVTATMLGAGEVSTQVEFSTDDR